MPETPKNEKPTLSKRDNLLMALKYLMCTAGAGIIQFVSFTLLNAAAHFDRLPVFLKLFPGAAVTELKYGPSYFVALALSVIFNFTANRKYTFRSACFMVPSRLEQRAHRHGEGARVLSRVHAAFYLVGRGARAARLE